MWGGFCPCKIRGGSHLPITSQFSESSATLELGKFCSHCPGAIIGRIFVKPHGKGIRAFWTIFFPLSVGAGEMWNQ